MSVGPEVNVVIGGKADPFLRAVEQSKQAAKGLAKEMSGELKNAVVSAFAIDAIKEAVVSTVEWGDGIDKASERLRTSTDNVQALTLAAREAGKGFDNVEESLTKIDVAASKALGGNGKMSQAFKNLEISQDDLKSLNKVDLLQKIAQGASKLPEGQAAPNLAAIVGNGNVGTILGMQGALSNFGAFKADKKESGAIASGEDLEQLSIMKAKFEALGDEMKAHMVPVLSWLIDKITWFVTGVRQLTEIIGTAIGAFIGSIEKFDIIGLLKSFGQSIIDGWSNLIKNLWDVIRGKESISDALGNVVDERLKAGANVINKTFGDNVTENVSNIVNDKLVEQAKEDAKAQAKEDQRKKDFDDKQKAFDGPASRTAAPGSKDQFKDLVGTVKGGGFTDVGNFIGADGNFRLERINLDMLTALKQIVQNTTPNDGGADDSDSIPTNG